MSTRNQCLVGFHIMNTVTVTWNLKSMWEIDSGPTYVTNPGHSLLSTLSFLFLFCRGEGTQQQGCESKNKRNSLRGCRDFWHLCSIQSYKKTLYGVNCWVWDTETLQGDSVQFGDCVSHYVCALFYLLLSSFFPKLVYNFQPKFVSETQPVRGWRHSHAFCKTTVTQDNG